MRVTLSRQNENEDTNASPLCAAVRERRRRRSTVGCGLPTSTPGNDRLSHAVPPAAPCPLEGLTSVFEMETGITAELRSAPAGAIYGMFKHHQLFDGQKLYASTSATLAPPPSLSEVVCLQT